MTFNILMGARGEDAVRRPKILEILARERPDVLALQECHHFDHDDETFLRDVAAITGLEPHLMISPRTRLHLALFRPPAWEERSRWIAESGFTHTAGWFSFQLPGGASLDVGCVHLDYASEDRRLEEARAVLTCDPRHGRAPLRVVLGDFNAVSRTDSYAFDQVARFEAQYLKQAGFPHNGWRHDVIDLFQELGFTDTLDSSPPAIAPFTWPAPGSREFLENPPMRIDRVMVQGFAPGSWTTRVITEPPADSASDHLPVVVELTL